MVIQTSEHVILLTKVLMMFSRRHIEVLSINTQNQAGGSMYKIVFLASREEASKLLLQVDRTVDVLYTQLTYHNMVDIPLKRQRASRIVPMAIS